MSSQRRPVRAQRRATSRLAEPPSPIRSAARAQAVRAIELELEQWRERAVPDPSMPLEADDVAQLVSDGLGALGLDEAAASSFTVNTVHFYRRKEILDAPEGRTSAARYALRHLWQALGARLAGQLGLLTLAEAREAMRGRGERVLLGFVAERVLDARARQAVRRSAPPLVMARPLVPAPPTVTSARALPAPEAPFLGLSAGTEAVVVSLPGNAICVIPTIHAAHRSPTAARALGRALSDALVAAVESSNA
jgi:hypothetical protein